MAEKRKIKGYYHVYLVNRWEFVVSEQLKTLTDSGLYDACDSISCGVLGSYENLTKFTEIIKQYPKITVAEYSTNEKVYEFQTLNILKTDAALSNDNYYVFYFHTKGISFKEDDEFNPIAYHGGAYWRRHMDKWTLEKWQQNIEMLDLGYETCGTQMRVREFPRHYSGNYWWAKSEYLRLLPEVGTLDISNRMNAEFFIAMAHPIAATLSQEFVDYYHPQQEGLDYSSVHNSVFNKSNDGRNIVHTLCFNLPEVIEEAVKSLYELNNREDFVHILIDVSYPLEKANEIPPDIEQAKKNNSERLKEMAKKYGSQYLKIDNQGVSQNWTSVIRAVQMKAYDVIIGAEPDEMVDKDAKGWVKAMADVLRSKHKYGVTSLMIAEQINSLNANNSEKIKVGRINTIKVKGDAMWGAIGISGDFLSKIGWAVPYPQEHNKYGGLEFALNQLLVKNGYSWCFLPDHKIEHPEWDFTNYYRQWKHYVLENHKGGQLSFEEFLNQKRDGIIK